MEVRSDLRSRYKSTHSPLKQSRENVFADGEKSPPPSPSLLSNDHAKPFNSFIVRPKSPLGKAEDDFGENSSSSYYGGELNRERRSNSLMVLNSWDSPENYIKESTWILLERRKDEKNTWKRGDLGRTLRKGKDGTPKKRNRFLSLKREKKDRMTDDISVLRQSIIEDDSENLKSFEEERFKSGVNLEMDSDGKIISAKIDEAIDQMMDSSYTQSDKEWIKMMGLVHRYFINSEDFLDRLLNHFDQNKLERRQALDSIITWVNTAPSDYKFGKNGKRGEMNKMAWKLQTFFKKSNESKLKEDITEVFDQAYARNQNHYREYTGVYSSRNNLTSSPSFMKRVRNVVSVTSSNSLRAGSLLGIPTRQLAEQLTLKEHRMFCCIRLDELTDQKWSTKDPIVASNIKVYIHYFNKVSNWVSTQIVSTSSEKDRIYLICKFIKLASKCYNLDNFNTSMEVFIGLSSGPVQKLSKTWSKIPKKYSKIFATLSEIFAPDGNQKNFRTILKNKTSLPSNPYLGLYLRDLTIIELHNPTTVQGRINFLKMRMISKIFERIEREQTVPYTFVENTHVQQQLDHISFVENSELWKRSSLCEQKAIDMRSLSLDAI